MATWNRAVETLPREELASLQLKGLRKTLRRLGRAEVSALEELARLPFSTAVDCRGRTLLSRCRADRRELVELHVDPVMALAIAATKGDLLQNAEAVARGFGFEVPPMINMAFVKNSGKNTRENTKRGKGFADKRQKKDDRQFSR